MKTVLFALTIAAASMAQASGFVCETESGLNIKVYNHTDSNQGTRKAAVMIISDSFVGGGNKTIARFTGVKQTLKSKSQTYVANVDLRFADSRNAGELIGGTKLGQLDEIVLDVMFSYASPVAAGTEVPATLTLVKRNGQSIEEEVSCVRYLKGE
jgi:hypothetical protein